MWHLFKVRSSCDHVFEGRDIDLNLLELEITGRNQRQKLGSPEFTQKKMDTSIVSEKVLKSSRYFFNGRINFRKEPVILAGRHAHRVCDLTVQK